MGTGASCVAFRLHAEWWHAEAKLSQGKPRLERARELAGLERDGAYAKPATGGGHAVGNRG
jgi:hypothetical protein